MPSVEKRGSIYGEMGNIQSCRDKHPIINFEDSNKTDISVFSHFKLWFSVARQEDTNINYILRYIII